VIQDPLGLFPTSKEQRIGKTDRRSREERERDERVAHSKRAVVSIGFVALAMTVLWMLAMTYGARR